MEPTESDQPVSGYQNKFWWNVGFSAYWFATSYKWFILLFILLPGMIETHVPNGEKNTYWGLIFGTGAIWAIVGPSIFGRLNETLGGKWQNRRLWIAIGTAGTVIALFTLFKASNLWLFGFAYLLLQVSDDVGTGPYAGMIADSVPKENRGYASSILGALKLFGQIASAIVALALRKPELIFIGIATVNILCALWTITTIAPVSQARVSQRPRENIFKEWINPFRDGDFLRVWLNRLIVSFAFACISAFTRNYLSDMYSEWKLFGINLGDAEMAAIVLALGISFAGIVGSIIAAKLADKTGRKPLLIWSAILIAFSLFPISFAREFTPILLLVLAFGIGNGIYVAADWALISDVLPNPDKAATEMGVWQSSETAVQVPAGIIMGFLIDLLNRQTFGLGYQFMIWTAASLFFVSIFLVKGIKGAR